jgi:hypothetical protein
MKNLSYWASRHLTTSRILIAISKLLLIALAFVLGIQFFLTDIDLKPKMALGAAVIFCLTYLTYPVKQRVSGLLKYTYHRRVRHDVLLIAMTFVILACGANQFAFRITEEAPPTPIVRLVVNSPDVHVSPSSSKEIRKEIRKNIRHQLKQMKESWKQSRQGGNSTAVKVFLIFLTLVFAFGLFVLVGSVSCQLSCNGNEGLAWIVLVLGVGGIIFLSVFLIRKILQGKRSERVAEKVVS